MKITKSQLEQIIKEELKNVLSESNFFANMRAKQKRCKGKPKTGDCAEDRPTKKQWKKITAEDLDEDLMQALLNDPNEKVSCKEFLKREEIEEAKTPAWQRKAGKNPEGGLNQKGRDSYKGGKLKAPVSAKKAKKNPGGKAAGRRKSFCARMCGMKKKNTGAKGKRDPDSRINKSLRKWDCNC